MKLKKILQISDYKELFGWIEIYIHNASKVLQAHERKTKTLWLSASIATLKRIRGFLLPITGFNLISMTQVLYYSIIRKPDVVRFHSVSRYHGWLPVRISWFFKSKKLMMYHDLGYFHPYPSKVTQENQVLKRSYSNWIKMGGGGSGVKFKFLSMTLLRRALLSTVDIHLVPSEFMMTYLINRWIPKHKIQVLPHFIPETF
jgi:hypothetical protein